ncbi:MAG TPA: Ku protein [Stellaceae bacterium]|nr:Ku protein [Stellaceae bacterium]
MPRASWNGFLRLSLVSCPVYLSPAVTEAAHIRLHQLNPKTGNRVRQMLVDDETGDKVERADIVKGYEYDRHQYVTISDDELAALKIESSQTIDLDSFVERESIDPLFLDTPYYVYPDGKIAIETFRVIGEAMEHKGRVGIGHIVMANRERTVMIEPRGGGMVMRLLRGADEVRRPEFGDRDADADPDMVSVAETIIERRAGEFDPSEFHDRYQEALHALVESKAQGKPIAKRKGAEPPPKVVDLMDALKRSLSQGEPKPARKSRAEPADRRQAHLLLPVSGGGKGKAAAAKPSRPPAAKPSREPAAKGRKRAS